ncbi:thyrotropin-releasing hormone-degrading ectoenzyme-like isoform X2 [Microplitis mediator]|uniref:thyrotropin-releasing hormone-degrading ectoenzyme-like isoform X2 n=2 Tax=Microplitis mediator TaxID=375433 RepID=UPI002553AC07|nr:thyrotropin-releasing hormone-degrading ectoenzyme-like isoform X2 [Microplitis mediator]
MMPSLPSMDYHKIFRKSDNMAQFSSNRHEFMTSEPGMNGIEYQREGGFFLSHRKLAIVITSIFLLLVAVGFVGAYAGAFPRKKIFDTTALISEDEGSEPPDAEKYSLSTSVFPSRYLVKLTPIVEDNEVSRVQGQVIIEFRYNGTMDLKHIVLNAKHMNITKIRMWSLDKNKERVESERTINPNESTNSTSSTVSTTDINQTVLNATNTTVDSIQTAGLIQPDQKPSLNSVRNVRSLDNESNSQSNFSSISNSSFTSEAPESLFTNTTSILNASNDSKLAIEEINISKSDVDEEHDILTIIPTSAIKSGNYSLEIIYEARTDNRTVLVANFSDEINDRWLMASRLKPINARRLFPLFDDVRLKARFTLSVAHPIGMTLLSNTPVKFNASIPDNWVIDTFEETPLLSPHSVALIQGHLLSAGNVNVSEPPIPVNFWTELGVNLKPTYLQKMISHVVKNFEELFSMKFPMAKLDIVSVPFADNSGTPGLISITQNLFNVSDTSPGVTRYETLKTLIRLIGRQWLGGLVNSQNWTDVWILESSLIDLQHYLVTKIDPAFNHTTFLLDVQLEAFEADGYSVSQSLKSKVNPAYLEAFHPEQLYHRGACLLHMLHGVLRQNDSRTGYRKFVSRWSNGNADVSSFLEAMTNESNHHPQQVNLVDFMESWINSHGYPVVSIKRDYKTATAKITQSRFRFDNRTLDDQKPWHIPLTWITIDKNWTSPSFTWMKPDEKEMTLNNVGVEGDEESWVIFNVNSLGYFRVNYDSKNWELIANALENNPSIFPSSVKASLVDDVLSLAFVGSTSYSTAFNVINYLKNESQPEPWTALMRHAIKLDLVLYDTPVYPHYQKFMRKLTSNLFDGVGSQVTKGSRMTLIAHQLGSTFENPAHVEWAKNSYQHFKDSNSLELKYEVPSYLRETLLCTFAKLEDQLGWEWWREKLGNITKRDTDRNSFLSSLACFQVPWILQAVLNEIVRGDLIEAQDAIIILRAFDDHPVSAQVAFNFVQKNWAEILKKFRRSYPVLRAFVSSVGSGFTNNKDLIDFQNFRDGNYESLKPVGYITAFVEAKGTSWISFLNHSLSDFENTINRLKD